MLVSIDVSKNLSVLKFPDWLKQNFLKDDNCAIVLMKQEKDQTGMNHLRFQQYYKGIKMENSMIIAHCNASIVASFNGDWFNSVSVLNDKSLSEAQAAQFA